MLSHYESYITSHYSENPRDWLHPFTLPLLPLPYHDVVTSYYFLMFSISLFISRRPVLARKLIEDAFVGFSRRNNEF